MLMLSALQELGTRSLRRVPKEVKGRHWFELIVDLPPGFPSSRRLPIGEFTLGRSPRCEIVLPELDVEVLAQLRLSPDGKTTILPFVGDLVHGSSTLAVGASVEFKGTTIFARGPLRLTIAATPASTRTLPTADLSPQLDSGQSSGPRNVAPRRVPLVPALLVGAAGLAALSAFQLGGPVEISSVMSRTYSVGDAGVAEAVRNLRLALASANIVSPVKVRLNDGRVILSGEVTEIESDRIAAIVSASRVPVPVTVQVTTPIADGRSHVAAMALSPTQLVVDKLGKLFRPGEAFHSWTIDSLEGDGLRLRRGDRIEIVSVPGRS
jgi:hypothetical protein